VLRSQNPFACWAVSRGLQTHSPSRINQDGHHHPGGSSWIAQPHTRILPHSKVHYHTTSERPSKSTSTGQGEVAACGASRALSILMYRSVRNGLDEGFQIYTQFFESFMKRSSQEIADLITRSDVVNFRRLSIQSIMDNDESFRNIGRQWNELCLVVRSLLSLISILPWKHWRSRR
jgi:hypothetical protein